MKASKAVSAHVGLHELSEGREGSRGPSRRNAASNISHLTQSGGVGSRNRLTGAANAKQARPATQQAHHAWLRPWVPAFGTTVQAQERVSRWKRRTTRPGALHTCQRGFKRSQGAGARGSPLSGMLELSRAACPSAPQTAERMRGEQRQPGARVRVALASSEATCCVRKTQASGAARMLTRVRYGVRSGAIFQCVNATQAS